MKNLFTSVFLLFAFSMLAQVPANDACSNAQAVVLTGGTACVNSTNLNATSDMSTNTCDTGTPGNEVWFTVVTTGTNNTITVTPNGATPATGLVVTLISTGCAAGTYDLCNSGAGGAAVTVTRGYAPGTQI